MEDTENLKKTDNEVLSLNEAETEDRLYSGEEESEEAEEQEEMANELATQQELSAMQTQIGEIYETGKSFGRPSFIKYFVFFSIAILNDGVDLLELTGVFSILAWFISFFLSFLLIFLFWFTNTKQVNAREHMHNLENIVKVFQKNIAHISRISVRTARQLKYVPGMSRAAKKVTTITKAVGSPLNKLIGGSFLEMVPFLSIFPWSTISVFLSYLDEKRIYINALEASEDAHSQLSQSISEMA